MKPRIALPAIARSVDTWTPEIVGAREPYLRALLACGAIPVILPLGAPLDVIEALSDNCTGLLLPGGEDVDPARYGEIPHPKLGKISRARDALELGLIESFWARSFPILAICRGFQILNVALGGKLFQDLESQHPGLLHESQHERDDWYSTPHELRLAPECRLVTLLGTDLLKVNSLHHQGIKVLSPELSAVGWSEDGLVEAVEAKSKGQFALGVQCHPETLWDKVDPRWKAFFQAFVDEAALTANSA